MIIILKRIFDFTASLFGLILLLPLFIIIAVLIKLDSKGSIFFLQDRLGKDGEVFKIYKFRTMVENAEEMDQGIYTHKNDSRITKVGNFLRKTSLDELPQLINVLKGDMSLVGPRPPVPYHPYKYDEYSDKQRLRFKVKPGITGYAQISGRQNLNWEEKIEYDIKYVKNYSFFLDIKLLFLTCYAVLKSKDIYRKS